MTVVDYIDLEDEECDVKVDFVDLDTDEDSVEKDGNVEGDDNVSRLQNVAKAAVSSSISEPEQDVTSTTSLSKLEQGQAATASFSMVEHGSTTSSVMAEETMQPEHQEFLATSNVAKEAIHSGNHGIAAGDFVGEALHSEHETKASVFSSMTEQGASTSLLLINRGTVVSSFGQHNAIQSGNQVFVAAVDCAEEAEQSENIAKASGSSSIIERGAIGVKEDTGNAVGSTRTHNLPAREEPEGASEKNENCCFLTEPEALCQEVRQDVLATSLPPQDKEKEISQCRKFYDRNGKKQFNTSTRECNRQLSIVHSKGVPPTLYNVDGGFSVMGNSMASIGINVLDGEVLVSTYQECSKTSQGNTIYGEVCDNSAKGCVIQGCTNGAYGGTRLCIFHLSRPCKKCCEVIGCATVACKGGRCRKHGGGKRCKYDGCGKGAQGKTDYCIAHGGGRRCKFEGCRKGAQGRSDYCIEHGGGRRCKFIGCSSSATFRKDLCSMHRKCMLNVNISAHEMLPEPAPVCWARKAERSKRRYSCSVIGGRAQERQNTSDYVNTRSFNVDEMAEEKGTVFIIQNSMLQAQQISHRMNSENGLAAGSPPLLLRH